ncbi:MAG: hypothetical protein ACI9LU_002922 [Polaribacter sp.]|jgi:hypothetical protein
MRKRLAVVKVIAGSVFEFDPTALACVCPAGNEISFRGVREDKAGNRRATFEGRLSQCRTCELKIKCMKNPSSADHQKGKVGKCHLCWVTRSLRIRIG